MAISQKTFVNRAKNLTATVTRVNGHTNVVINDTQSTHVVCCRDWNDVMWYLNHAYGYGWRYA